MKKDNITILQTLKDDVEKMVQERDWTQFHSLKSLSMSIAVEAAELMEHFLWIDSINSYPHFEQHRSDIEDELSDILIGIFAFANRGNIDLTTAFAKKLANIKHKYPIEKAKGKSDKYDRL